MAEVIPFRRREPEVQVGGGPAFCLSCDHAWEAVAPTGTIHLECPACRRMTGHFRFEYQPAPGQQVRTCRCENQLFYLTREGHLCASCGVYQRYE